MIRWRCRRYQPLLVDDADGVLDAARRQELNRHLAACVRCTSDLAALREVPAVLHTSTFPDPGEEFWRSQRQAIGQVVRNLPAPHSTWQFAWVREALRLSPWRFPVALAASLLVVLFVYRFAERVQAPTPEPGPHVAALDPDALGALSELMQAVIPRDDFIPALADDDEALLAALPLSD